MKWFVITNRERSNRGSFNNEPERAGKVHFLAKERTALPKSNRDLKVDYIGDSDSEESTGEFVKAIQAELVVRQKALDARGIEKKPALLLYSHGYNNDYKDALEEYTELRRNFNAAVPEFEDYCLPVLFTWPSAGWSTAYLEDRDDARASYPAISNLVHLLFRETRNLAECISNICVLAHSMGNYVYREAFGALAGSPFAPAGHFINQFLCIGADIGNTSLEPGGKGFGITRFSDRVTVYFSPEDGTLGTSKRKNGRPRLGRTLSSGYQSTPDNVVFVDCREWANEDTLEELFPENAPSVHSCYRSVPAVLREMFEVLTGRDRDVIAGRERRIINKSYRLVNRTD